MNPAFSPVLVIMLSTLFAMFVRMRNAAHSICMLFFGNASEKV